MGAPFAGQSALVCGGAGGLGGATARRLAELGMAVVIFEPDAERAQNYAAELNAMVPGSAARPPTGRAAAPITLPRVGTCARCVGLHP